MATPNDPSAGRLSATELIDHRADVLAELPTEQHYTLEEAVALHRAQAPDQNVARAQRQAALTPLIVMPADDQEAADQIETLGALWFAGADVLVTEPDGYSRQGRHELAGTARDKGAQTLDGVPPVSLGVLGLRQITAASPGPSEAVIDSVDPRLLADLFLGAGFSALAGGVYTSVSSRLGAYPAGPVVAAWQYVEALCGYYEDAGVPVVRTYRAADHAPRSAQCALLVLDALFGAEQGVRSVLLELRSSNQVLADAAALIALGDLARSSLADRGFGAVEVGVGLVSATGERPDEFGHLALTHLAATTALGARARRIRLEPPRQLQGLTDRESRASLVRAVHATRRIAHGQGLPLSGELVERAAEIERGANSQLAELLPAGSSPALAMVAAAESRGYQVLEPNRTEARA